MKRNRSHAVELLGLAKSDQLLGKQLEKLSGLDRKDQAAQAVRLGRMHGLYFSEQDWLAVGSPSKTQKAS